MSESIEAPIVDNPSTPDNQPPEANFEQRASDSLDAALSGMFKGKPPEEKPNEKEKDPVPVNKDEVKTPDAERPKDGERVDKGEAKPDARKKVELPDPESISDSPAKDKSGKTGEGWRTLKSNYKEAHAQIAESQRQIEALKKEIAEKVEGGTKETEKLKSEMAELSKYRAMVDIQADPEFMDKYDKPLQESEKSIRSMLTSMGVSAEVAGQVNPLDAKMMETIINHVSENKDKFTARKLERKVEDYMNLHDKRTETLAEHKENYSKTLDAKKKEAFSRGAEEEGRMLKHFEALSRSENQDKTPRFPFLAKREVPSGSNSGQTEQIEAHNKMVEASIKKVNEVMRMNGPEQRAEIAIAAISSPYLSSQNESLRKKVSDLEAEIKKLSATTEETPKTKVGRNDKGQYEKPNEGRASLDDALNAAFGR